MMSINDIAVGLRAIVRGGSDGQPSRRACRYLISPAGVPNYGDELIARSWLRWLAEAEPDSDVWLDCINPGRASVLFGGDHPCLHVTDTTWQIVWEAQRIAGLEDHGRQAELVEGWLRHLGTPREDLGIMRLVSADTIHLLGGGHITGAVEANHALIPLIAATASGIGGAGLLATGLGVAPWDEDERLSILRSSLASFSHVGFRDAKSLRVAGLGEGVASLDHDDAWLSFLPQCSSGVLSSPSGSADGAGEAAGGPGGWVDGTWRDGGEERAYAARAFVSMNAFCVPDASRADEAASRVAAALEASGISRDETIAMVEAIPPEDAAFLPAMDRAWGGDVVLLPLSLLWRRGLPGGSDAVWMASRYHLHLMAAAAGARGVALLGGGGYYANKHAALLAEGTGWSSLSLGESDGAEEALPPESPADAAEGVRVTCDEGFGKVARRLAVEKGEEAARLYGM